MAGESDLLHGTLDILVLKTLTAGARHGYAVARAIENVTGDVVQVEEGSLYPALYRMERKGFIEAEWGVSELNRKVKLYRLTAKGRKRLASETAEWLRFSAAITRLLTA